MAEALRLNPESIKLAIIIPEFNQPQLAIEAIEDALGQRDCPPTAVVLSTDASWFDEIDEIAQAYQATAPNFYYLRARRNRGLAGNRNAAVRFCLRQFPQLQALTFLDSDDRLHSRTLAHFNENLIEAKKHNPNVGWIYTDPYQFGGIHGYLRKPTRYKVLWHMLANSNSATSLVDVEVFQKGCFFDEGMKKGSEDWAFWLSAVDKGFIGKFVLPPTFGYRRRAESMSSDATFYRHEIVDYVKSRFPSLYNRKRILELQDRELPPYALVRVDQYEKVSLFSDAAVMSNHIEFRQLVTALVEQRADPLSHAVRSVCVCHARTAEGLIKLGIFGWLNWAASNAKDFTAVYVYFGADKDRFEIVEENSDRTSTSPDAIFCSFAGIEKLKDQHCDDLKRAEIHLKQKPVRQAVPVKKFFEEVLVTELETAGFHRAELARQHLALWKPGGAIARDVADQLLDTKDHFPLKTDEVRISVGVLTDSTFLKPGNVEALLNFLRYFHKRSDIYRLTVFLPSASLADGIALSRLTGLTDMFFLPAGLTSIPRSDEKHYLGAKMTPWMVFGDKKLSTGPFVSTDILFNLSAAEYSALAFPLSKLGVRNVAVVAPDVRTSHGRGRGVNFRSPVYGQSSFVENVLAYEHAYHSILTGSLDDVPWLVSKGLPRDKIKAQAGLWAFDIRRLRNTIKDTTLGHMDDVTSGGLQDILLGLERTS